MKANITDQFTALSKAFALTMFLIISSIVNAQTPTPAETFKGGKTYWVDGNGADYVLPKDTFANLTGAHVENDPFTQSTGILSALNNQGVDPATIGTITFMLAPGYAGVVEPNLINIGKPNTVGGYPYMTAQRGVLIKPAPGTTFNITSSAAFANNNSLVRFNGAQYVTIDGEGTAGQRNIKFYLSSAASSNTLRVIDFIPTANTGSQYLTVKNCIIVGNSQSNAINTYAGIYSGGSTGNSVAPLRPSQFISVINNLIVGVQNPIYFRGIEATASRQDNGLVVSNNEIGSDTSLIGGSSCAGITIISQKNAVVSGNTIKNNIPGQPNFRGIQLGNSPGAALSLDSNISITGNKIYNLRSILNGSPSGIYGIRLTFTQSHTYPLGITIANNTIGNILTSQGNNALAGSAAVVGLMVEDNSPNSGLNILNNSIHLYGDTMSVSAVSACLLTSNSTTGGIKVANNIFVNRLGRSLNSAGLSSISYIYIVNSTTNPFSSIGNNAYFSSNTAGSFSFIGNFGNSNKESMRTWSAATGDNSSITNRPPFVGTSDDQCVISNGAASILGNYGVPVGITTDINGNARSATTPSLGAYEFSGNAATANYSLKGGTQYLINGVSNWPAGPTGSGSFATLADAVTYLNTYGVGGLGTVNLRFTSGYSGETTFIPQLLNYTGASSSRLLLIDVAPGASVTVSAPALNFVSSQYSVFNMLAAKYVTINGSSTAGQRNLTFAVPSTFATTSVNVIGILPSESDSITDITISNCNIVGSSSPTIINTGCGIYHGGYASAGFSSPASGFNKNINILGNSISAVRTGIYFRGANISNGHTRNVKIERNTIGGDIHQGMGLPITYIGGAGSQAGILLKGIAVCSVDSNIIRNCDSVAAASSGFRGIDLDILGETNAIDSAITVSRNTIYNLTTATGPFCVGIRVSLGSSNTRALKMHNNSISKIRGVGSSLSAISTNPAGILIDGSGTITNLDLEIYHNTVRLNGNTLNSNFSSACLFIASSIQGGVKVQNNIFMNNLGRNSVSAGNAFAVYSGASSAATSPFALTSGGFINGNTYGADATNTANNYLIGAGSSNFSFVKQWQAFINQDQSSVGFNAFFTNDSTPHPDPRFTGLLYNGSLTMLQVPKDITGATRPASSTCPGALQFTQDYLPLAGDQTYLINGANNFPRTSGTAPFTFATILDAINYLNANGVDGLSADVKRVTLKLSAGYTGEMADTFIPAIRAYPKMNASRIVTLTTSPGRNDTIRTSASRLYPQNGSVIRFLGASYFEIDGDDGSGNRAITIALPNVVNSNAASLKLIDITPADNAARNITIRNCNLIGTSASSTSISTYAGIYLGGTTATPSSPLIGNNDNHIFENNFIGAVRYGIYTQGFVSTMGMQDRGLVIKRNIIGSNATYGGNTLNWGGNTAAAGIFLSAQSNTLVDSNVIRYNMPNYANNRGIELSSASQAALAVDSGITIARNTISNIANTTASGGAYGIYMSFADSITPKNNRAFTIKNNMISAITAPGTAPALANTYNSSSPIGIFVEETILTAKGEINNFGLRIWNNSVNLGYDTALSANNGVSACIAFSPAIKGGVIMQNNIFQNRLGKGSGAGTAAAVIVGNANTIFSSVGNNIYYTQAPNVTNIMMASAYSVAGIAVYNTLKDVMAFTNQDTMSLNFITNFTSETNLLLSGPNHNAYSWGAFVTSVTDDIQGEARNPFLRPTIGADELPFGSFVDSIAPRIYDITKQPLFCNSGSSIPLQFRVFERATAVASDTLYYTVNNGPELFIAGATSVNEFTRTYTIPAQPDNTSIAYRLAVRDNSPLAFRTVYPETGYSYTATSFNSFPITYGFDLPNAGGWTVDNNVNNNPTPIGWNLNSFGSFENPVVLPKTGLKAALFPAASLPSGTISRIVSPCMDFSNLKVPTIRIWVSQNGESLSNEDLVQITVSGGFNIWSSPLGIVRRPNANLGFPDYTQLDVCLSNFAGQNGMRIGIEGISRAGMNIVLDSIVIFDDILNQPVTPLAGTICAYNPVALNIASSSNLYSYTLVDARNGLPLGSSVLGKADGSALSITAPNPSNPAVSRVDELKTVIQYVNTQSGCKWQMPDTSTLTIKNFFGGPFVDKGAPFSGVYSTGTLAKPDGAKLGDTLTYTILPPSGLTNADYGTKWTIVSPSIATPIDERPFANYTFTAATSSTNAYITAKPSIADVDSVFKVSATIRFLPSGCDSVVVRYLKVTSAPSVSFTSARDSVCSGAAIHFTNTTTYLPNTAPITYTWTFGDGTSASTGDANKIFAFDKAPGIYTVTLKATNNAGVFSTVSKEITVLPAPLTTFTNSLACGNDPIAFTNTTTNSVSNLWTVRLNNQVKDTSTQLNPSFAFAIADTIYNVTLRTTNNLGCFRDSVRGVFAFAKPVPSFTTVDQCAGKNATFINNSTISSGGSSSNNFGSVWDFGNGDIRFGNTPVYKYPASGTYTVKLKVTSNFGCTDSTTRTVTIYERPVSGFTTGIACQDNVVSINNTTTYNGSASNKVLYAWDFGDFSPISNDVNPVKTFGLLGNFTIKLIAHDTVHNCYDTTAKTIEVNELPVFTTFSSTSGCVNTPVEFNNGSIPPDGQTLTYAWNFGDGGTSTATSPAHAYAGSGKFTVTMRATTNKGCFDEFVDSVNIDAVPDARFSWDTVDCKTVKFTPGTLGLSNYRWDFGDSSKLNASDGAVQNIYQKGTWHKVTLTVTSFNGCTSSHSEDSVWTYCTVGVEELFANKFGLSVYPNPFENIANISYHLDTKENVTVTVMDILGRKVSEVTEVNQSAGSHSIQLDQSKFASTSAVYMVRIQIGDDVITKQLIRQ